MVKRFEHDGRPDGREAWIELERIYGGKEIDERPSQILALDGKLREARCSSVSDTPDFIVRLDRMWVEFESLGDPRSDYVKRAAILFVIRDALPTSLISLRRD